MTQAEWLSSVDPEPMIRLLPADRYRRELRLFSIACVRRVWRLVPPGRRAAIEVAERFAMGQAGEEELAAVAVIADREAREAFLGNSAPDARAYAASAAVDASSVWPRTTAIVLAATSCAASAAGCAAAEADEARYDQWFESARQSELAEQAALLRSLVRFPVE